MASAVLAGTLTVALPGALYAAVCPSSAIAVDTTGSITSVASIWGEAPGQTFYAEDTLITAITVWRIASQDTNRAPMKLWIVNCDSTGRPRNDQIVFDGPAIISMYGVEVRFDLDPPAILPRRGRYAFMVQNMCDYIFDLRIHDDVYGPGELWRSEISNYHGCVLWIIFDHWNEYDLCCRVEFCDAVTPVRHPTWGRVKAIYR